MYRSAFLHCAYLLDDSNMTKLAPLRREIELDFIRGLAILLVLDYHSPHPILLKPLLLLGWPHFGWIGVDIFFVLSGFLVGGLLVKEREVRGRIDAKRFLVRRGFKIWPQYYCLLFVMIATGHRGTRELWGNLLNIQNYVGGVANTWSLAVEEQAYIVLVIVLGVVSRRCIRTKTLFVAFAIASLCILFWSFVLASRGVNTFARTDTRLDGILYGVMLSMLYHHAPQLFRRVQSYTWVWTGTILLMLALFRVGVKAWWWPPLSWGLADAAGVAVLFLLYKQNKGLEHSAIYRLVAWIGLYSYGIYLWHISVIKPVMAATGHIPAILVPIWEYIVPGLSGVALGICTTRLVEFPSLKLRDRLFPRRIDSAVGIPAVIEQTLNVRSATESVS